MHIEIEQLQNIFTHSGEVLCDMSRTDLYNKDVPGNKYFKMKYNIEEMRNSGLSEMVTFGGAFSNHIAAVARSGQIYEFGTTGVIRGESSSWNNETLSLAQSQGMKLKFIDRSTYREWKKGKIDLSEFVGIEQYYSLPEGGSNVLALKGCSEITKDLDEDYDVITCPVGSGGTLAGLIVSSSDQQEVLGFSALKGGDFLKEDVQLLLEQYDKEFGTRHSEKTNWQIITEYHFGGFAKMNEALFDFYTEFRQKFDIELDLIYTAKMMVGLSDMVKKGEIKAMSKILAIHTGGRQGNKSMLKRHGFV